jgi:integrase
MAAKILTSTAVENLRPGKERREIADAKGGGRGSGLYLVIQPSGQKSWCMRFRRPDGRPAKLVLGPVDFSGREIEGDPVIGMPLTLAAARQLATTLHRERVRGVDVIEEHKAAKSRERTEAEDAAVNTFGKLVVEFIRDHKVKRWGTRPRRWRGDAAILGLRWPQDCEDPAKGEPIVIKGGLADTWRDKPLGSIDGHDIHSVVDEARKLGIPGLEKRNKAVSDARGRKMHSGLSNFFRWAQRQRKVSVNPVQGVWNPGAPPARERVLNDAEIKKFWLATEQVREPVTALLKVLLLTGQRLAEVNEMRDDEIVEGVWTIPGSRTKNHRPHALTLPPLVRDIIAKVEGIEGSPFVFTGDTGMTAVTIGSKVKTTLDEAMGEEIDPWRLHDLRRSAASGMQRLGIRPDVIERLLNHVSGTFSGVAGIYQRDPLSEEVAAALVRWSQHVVGLIEGGSTNVVKLPKGRGRS